MFAISGAIACGEVFFTDHEFVPEEEQRTLGDGTVHASTDGNNPSTDRNNPPLDFLKLLSNRDAVYAHHSALQSLYSIRATFHKNTADCPTTDDTPTLGLTNKEMSVLNAMLNGFSNRRAHLIDLFLTRFHDLLTRLKQPLEQVLQSEKISKHWIARNVVNIRTNLRAMESESENKEKFDSLKKGYIQLLEKKLVTIQRISDVVENESAFHHLRDTANEVQNLLNLFISILKKEKALSFLVVYDLFKIGPRNIPDIPDEPEKQLTGSLSHLNTLVNFSNDLFACMRTSLVFNQKMGAKDLRQTETCLQGLNSWKTLSDRKNLAKNIAAFYPQFLNCISMLYKKARKTSIEFYKVDEISEQRRKDMQIGREGMILLKETFEAIDRHLLYYLLPIAGKKNVAPKLMRIKRLFSHILIQENASKEGLPQEITGLAKKPSEGAIQATARKFQEFCNALIRKIQQTQNIVFYDSLRTTNKEISNVSAKQKKAGRKKSKKKGKKGQKNNRPQNNMPPISMEAIKALLQTNPVEIVKYFEPKKPDLLASMDEALTEKMDVLQRQIHAQGWKPEQIKELHKKLLQSFFPLAYILFSLVDASEILNPSPNPSTNILGISDSFFRVFEGFEYEEQKEDIASSARKRSSSSKDSKVSRAQKPKAARRPTAKEKTRKLFKYLAEMNYVKISGGGKGSHLEFRKIHHSASGEDMKDTKRNVVTIPKGKNGHLSLGTHKSIMRSVKGFEEKIRR
ncbi:MAG: hypothetical protein AAGI90_03180 [Chlamydiota bacterium]